MAETFKIEIVTPDRQVVEDFAEEAQIPGRNGYLGILPGHAPLITELDAGEITYRNGPRTEHLAVGWGFAEVLPGRVTILAETAERAEEIDPERARKAADRAEGRLSGQDADVDFRLTEAALKRALVRLQVSGKHKGVAPNSGAPPAGGPEKH
jgi:F-type H+-transporting ATPase subunit epsilon